MQPRKGKKVLIYLFLLILLGSINNISLNETDFYNIKKINVSGLDEKDNQKLLKDIKNLNLGNIFFLSAIEIDRIMNSNTFIENYNVFKKYPSSIDIKLKKTNFLAKINLDGQLYFVGSNGKLTESFDLSEELPYIFGKLDINRFLKFKKIIDNSKISYNEIKSLFFFQSKRWDIELKNNILIKLSSENIEKALDDVNLILNEKSIKRIKIIDARVKNQIIINE